MNSALPEGIDAGDLTEREIKIAQLAAKLAVQDMTDQFYKGVGRTVIQRFLIIVGAVAAGFFAGRGWPKLLG